MIRRPPRSTQSRSSAASDVYKRQRLARALRALTPEIEPLPPVLTVADALARKAQMHGLDNVFATYRISKGDAARAIALSSVRLTGRYRTHHQEQLYIEPQGMLAFWDANGAHVVGSLQCPFYVHKGVKRTFSLDDARVDVTQAVTGGGFGGKEAVSYTHLRAHETRHDLV